MAAVALSLFEEEVHVRTYLRHLMIAACVLSLIALYQFQYRVNVFTATGSTRATGTLGNPNDVAAFLVLAMPCILCGIDAKLLPKAVAWPIFLTVIGGVLATVSRKGIITMAFSVLLYYVLKKDFKKLLVIIILFVLLGLKLYGCGGRVAIRFTEDQFKREEVGRGAMISAGLGAFLKSPLVGIGYRGFFENFGVYFPDARGKKYDAHNMYITVLVDSGLLGFLPFISIFLYPLFISLNVLRRRSDASGSMYSRSAAAISICSVLSFMIMGFFAGSFFSEHIVVALLYVNASLAFEVREQRG
jgi:O-antigen ligase